MYRQFRKHIATSCFVLLSVFSVWAQTSDSAKVVVSFEGIDLQYIPKYLELDSFQLIETKKQIISELRMDGYWLASFDSTKQVDDTLKVYGFQGKPFDEIQLTIIDEKNELDRFPRFPKIKPGQISLPNQIEMEVDAMLNFLESNGYPFASLTLDSCHFIESILNIQIRLDLGTKITYDSLDVKPKNLINSVFLSRYLRLNYGKNYNERDLVLVKDKIQFLPFLSLEKMSTSFQLKKARVALELKPVKVNYFDGILGLVPRQNGEGVELTGELDLSLNNLFQSGKKVEVNWKKLEPGSQQLHASYLHPILLGSPLDFYFALEQTRQDTIYSNRSLQLAFDYRPSRRIYMRISYENLLGNELDDQSGTSGDFEIDYYGLGITWSKLDHLYFPKNGISIQWIGNIGRKNVSNVGNSIPESTQYRLQAHLQWYKKLSQRSVLYLASQNGVIFNDYLYLNDLFRVGGLKTIRGFNELEFFASKYTLFNLEWRYYLDQTSYLVTFYDQSFLSYDILNGSFSDQPAGLGAGMQFSTERGNFRILYGLGKRDGEAFSFSTSKIHFGYTAIF